MRTSNSTSGNGSSIRVRVAPEDDSSVIALPGVLEKWMFQVIQEIKEAIAANRLPQEAGRFIEMADADNQALRRWLIRSLLQHQANVDKQELLTLQQSMIVSIMNGIGEVTSSIEFGRVLETLGDELQSAFETTLAFMNQNVPDYFNWDCPLPKYTRKRIGAQQQQTILLLREKFQNLLADETSLLNRVLNHIGERDHSSSNMLTYHDVSYMQTLIGAVQGFSPDADNADVRQLLYRFNYNESWFSQLECERLSQQAAIYDNPKQRIAVLKLEQKQLNQTLVVSANVSEKKLPSLKMQLNTWADEEIKFLESGYATNVVLGEGKATDKIQTSLSVAKLAVIIRLLVVDKIIINRTVAPMLRIVAKMFATLQRDEISFVSLETKFHAPDKATVSAVRDMLFKWIGILDKL